MKKLVSVANAVLICVAFGSFAAPKSVAFSIPSIAIQDQSYSQQRNVEIVHSNELAVNMDSRKRYIVKLNETAGIEMMRKLVLSSPYEEAYIRVPEVNLWFECGINERIVESSETLGVSGFGVSSTVVIDDAVFRSVASDFDKITLYHFHPLPLKVVSEYVWNALEEKGEHRKMTDIEAILKRIIKLESAPAQAIPRNADLEDMIIRSNEFYKLKPGGKINFGICSEMGVTTYELSDTGKDFFRDKQPDEIRDYCNHVRERLKPLINEWIRDNLWDKRVKELVLSLGDNMIKVNYLSYKDYFSLNK